VPPDFITAQIDAVFSDLAVDAVKVGMLSTPAAIEAVAEGLDQRSSQRRARSGDGGGDGRPPPRSGGGRDASVGSGARAPDTPSARVAAPFDAEVLRARRRCAQADRLLALAPGGADWRPGSGRRASIPGHAAGAARRAASPPKIPTVPVGTLSAAIAAGAARACRRGWGRQGFHQPSDRRGRPPAIGSGHIRSTTCIPGGECTNRVSSVDPDGGSCTADHLQVMVFLTLLEGRRGGGLHAASDPSRSHAASLQAACLPRR
jgi:hypothetical protein